MATTGLITNDITNKKESINQPLLLLKDNESDEKEEEYQSSPYRWVVLSLSCVSMTINSMAVCTL